MIMDNVRVNLNSNEKLARSVVGIDTDAKHFTLNGKNAEDILQTEAVNKFNDAVDEYVERFNEHSTKLDEFAQQINDNVDKIEIMPILNYILVKPFSENPFQRIVKSDSGIIIDLGGQKPTYKNTDNGEIEEEENIIRVAVVQEIGQDVKYIRPGDTIMYTKMSEVPVPFYKQGLALVNENRVIVTINEGLTERFNNLKKQ